MTTVVVFLPLAFIPGLFGAFFSPFALTVTFALIASLFVALTAVPVLGAYLLRPGDLPEGAGDEGDLVLPETAPAARLRRNPPLGAAAQARHAARRRADHPVEPRPRSRHPRQPLRRSDRQPPDTGHAAAGDRPGADPRRSRRDRGPAERRLRALLGDRRRVPSSGSSPAGGRPAAPSSSSRSGTTRRRTSRRCSGRSSRSPGSRSASPRSRTAPRRGGVDVVVTGPDYGDIAAVSRELTASLGTIGDIVNLENTVAQARPEVAIEVDPQRGRAPRPHHAPGRLSSSASTSSARP